MSYLFQTDPIPLKISKKKVKNCLCKRTWICWEQCEDIEKKKEEEEGKPCIYYYDSSEGTISYTQTNPPQ
jgi:hypothetical protein